MGIIAKFSKKNKGQSFIELAITFTALMVILLGVVELGFLLNQYLELQDTVREVARIGSKSNPWTDDSLTTREPAYFTKIATEYGVISSRSLLELDPATDDIVLSFYQINGTTVTKLGGDWQILGNHVSMVSTADIASHVDAAAPCAGLIVVEGFYDYHQLLGAPGIASYLEDPIPVHTFTIMPLPAAEPKTCH
jgi:hypothetical protein